MKPYLKLGFIIFLILALLIPQAFIRGLVSERESWRSQAFQSIEQSWPGAQTLSGPILAIPYHLTFNSKEQIIDADKKTRSIIKEVTEDNILYIIPKQLTVAGKLDSSLRYRGIYEVPVYQSQYQVHGEFSNQAMLDLASKYKNYKLSFEKPIFSVLVTDQRGIAAPPKLTWNGQQLDFQPGAHLAGATAGMHTLLPTLNSGQATSLSFNFDIELRGMRAMNFALVSEDITVQAAANWPHPGFIGELLPEQRHIDQNGFTAEWKASAFSHNVSGVLERCQKGECQALLENNVGFELIQPVDVYQQSDRSIKYAALFIVLTFVVLMLFELIKKLRIHPIQYTLVGMALLVFYLLLISLSEHIPFLSAYVTGASASTGLLTLYFGGIVRSHKLGLLLGSGLTLLYMVLYVILQAEESALLMGSLLLFTMLAILMLVTRNFDWYALTGQNLSGKQVCNQDITNG